MPGCCLDRNFGQTSDSELVSTCEHTITIFICLRILYRPLSWLGGEVACLYTDCRPYNMLQMMPVVGGFNDLRYNGQSTKCLAIFPVRHSQHSFGFCYSSKCSIIVYSCLQGFTLIKLVAFPKFSTYHSPHFHFPSRSNGRSPPKTVSFQSTRNILRDKFVDSNCRMIIVEPKLVSFSAHILSSNT